MSELTGHETIRTRRRNFAALLFEAACLFSNTADDLEQIARWGIDTLDGHGLLKDLQKVIHDFDGKLANLRASMNLEFDLDTNEAI